MVSRKLKVSLCRILRTPGTLRGLGGQTRERPEPYPPPNKNGVQTRQKCQWGRMGEKRAKGKESMGSQGDLPDSIKHPIGLKWTLSYRMGDARGPANETV